MKPSQRLVVVGGVAAGMSAAAQVRRRHPNVEVTVFERGNFVSYGACGMPYNLADPNRPIDDLIVMSAENARNERGIDLHLRSEVISIQVPNQAERGLIIVRDLNDESEREEPYDALIIAAGARAAIPPIPGIHADGVSALRDLGDATTIKHLLETDPKHGVIIGGGYIGLEMAHTLHERGLEVLVVEKTPQILPGWSASTVGVVGESLENHGVRVMTGVSVEEIEHSNDGCVSAVRTSSGTFKADLVIVATGIRPNVALAAQAGLRIGDTGAIWVDQYQKTSAGPIWAAGDCAESYHRVLRRNAWIPLGTTANKQGRIAGANAMGGSERFFGITGTAGFVVLDLEVARTGLGLEEALTEGFEPTAVTIHQSSKAHNMPGASPVHVTLVADAPTGLFLGAEIVGHDGAALRINPLAAALAAHMNVSDLQNLDLVYAPPFSPVWDPVLVAANQLIKKVGRKP